MWECPEEDSKNAYACYYKNKNCKIWKKLSSTWLSATVKLKYIIPMPVQSQAQEVIQ